MMLKTNIHKLGNEEDRATHANNPRLQNSAYQDNVNEARRLIYCEGAGIKSVRVESLLKETSSVPTIVCPTYIL